MTDANAARHDRLRELFVGACARAGDERAAWLDEACGDDTGLRRDVEQLLAHDERPGTQARAMSAGAGAQKLALELAAAGRADDEDGEDLPRTLGRYTLLRVIGRGGMGVVYEARQEDPARRVALKVVRPGRVSRALLGRFRQEAQVLGQLQHPGIAQIYEAGTADQGEGGQPYFAMEYVEGRSLLEFASAMGLGTRERLTLIAQVCDAVHHAHLRGVIHRDLKPANLVVTEPTTGTRAGTASGRVSISGQPKVLDFGVARLTDADIRTVTVETSVGELVGTVPYMSPEQAAGDPAGIDIRSDVYALGVTAYELLAGRLPYDVGGKMIHEAVRIIREEEPSRLSVVDRAYRGDVEIIIGKALEKERDRRYQSAEALADDIRRHLGNEPIVARPASTIYQLRKFARRHRALTTGAAIAFAAMLIATVVSVWLAGVARLAEEDADYQRGLADERAIAAEQSAWDAYRSTILGAGTALDMGDAFVVHQLLDGVSATHRHWETGYLLAQAGPAVAALDRPADLLTAGFGADAEQVITVSGDGSLQRWDPYLPHEPLATIRLDESPSMFAAVSADGARLAALTGEGRDTLMMWDTRTGARLAEASRDEIAAVLPKAASGSHVAISADGNHVFASFGEASIVWTPFDEPPLAVNRRGKLRVRAAAISGDGAVRAWTGRRPNDAAGIFGADSIPRSFRHPNNDMEAVALTFDGRLCIAGATNAVVDLFDLQESKRRHLFKGHTGAITAAAIAPGEPIAATGADDGTVRLWDLERLEPRSILPGHVGDVSLARFSTDGRLLLTLDESSIRIFDVASDTGPMILRGHRRYVYGVGFTAGGARIVSGAWDGALRFWDATTGESIVEVPTETSRILCIAAPPEGTFIATGHEGGHVQVRCADTGRLLRRIQGLGGRVVALDATPDGRRLVARSASRVSLLDPATGTVIDELKSPAGADEFGAVAISPDGRLVAYERRETVVLWRVGSAQTRELAGHDLTIDALAFSPDGKQLASGSRDNTVRLWNVVTFETIHVLDRHSNRVYAAAFSPDGARLASASDDRTIAVWDTVRGDFLTDLVGHDEYVFALAFSPDGTQIVSGSGDHTVRVWDARAPSDRRRAAARRRAARAEAGAIVDRLWATHGDPTDVADAVRNMADLTAEQREAALQAVLRRSVEAGFAGAAVDGASAVEDEPGEITSP